SSASPYPGPGSRGEAAGHARSRGVDVGRGRARHGAPSLLPGAKGRGSRRARAGAPAQVPGAHPPDVDRPAADRPADRPGLTQRELAERLGISESLVPRDERNEYHGITVERAQRILDALGETVRGRVKLRA